MSWELVAGIETHVELSTKTKIFCNCTIKFGSEPNTQCCPICTGMPGALPKLNKAVVEYAVKAGLATNCKINNITNMDRKNYFYPDLPKAYQITQYDKPLCEDGHITLSTGKKINIERIHIEEDAGKLIYSDNGINIDYNRAGVPLIEIVTKPDIRSIDEAIEYIEQLRLIMKYIGVSDVKMQEGSLRCDVNISVRRKGQEFGTRTEIKNMNSLNFIRKAMEYEFKRQVEILENGGEIYQETRRYDEKLNITQSMRGKEDITDYRYFREADLANIFVSDEEVKRYKESLPELPNAKYDRFVNEHMLPADDAKLIVKYKKISEYFEEACKEVQNKKIVANYILGQIFRRLSSEIEKEECKIPFPPEYLKELVLLIEKKNLNTNIARSVLEKMLDTGRPANEFISESDMEGMDSEELKSICARAVEINKDAVEQYLKGRDRAIRAIIGFVMKETKGKADAALATEYIKEIINN